MKVYTKSGCGFATVEMSEECHTYNEALARRLSDGEHTPDIVMTSMVRGGGDELGASVAALLQPVVDAGAEPVIVNDNPSPGADELGTDVTVYGCVRDHPDDYSACSYASGPGSGARALAVAADRLDAPFVDLSRWVCPDTGRPEPACPPVIGRVLAFRQGSHLTATYVASLTPILHHELIRAGVATTQLDQVQWRLPDVASG